MGFCSIIGFKEGRCLTLGLLCFILKKSIWMPNIKSKSIENFKAAKLLSKDGNKMYSASIHCAYYSCFQLVKHILAKIRYIPYSKQETDAIDSKIGTHNFIIETMRNDLLSIKEEEAYDIFDNNITELKRLRKIADYDNVIISPEEAKDAVNMADETLETLKGVYKGL